jgi:outer membrane receptor for ferrienterochelin and colicin
MRQNRQKGIRESMLDRLGAKRFLHHLSRGLSLCSVSLYFLPSNAQTMQSTQVAPVLDAEIVVRADPSNRRDIDREVYIVKDTPLAQTKAAIEVIQNLPSVSVDATGQLRLLGSSSVQILIDGRSVPNAGTVLNSLQASQIERIEVITNPSAKFSAYGSAGIINIVLRRTFKAGLTGSAVVGAGNFEFATSRLSPTWKASSWSVSLSPAATSSTSSIDSRLERNSLLSPSTLNRIEQTSGRGDSRAIATNLQFGYEPSKQQRYSLTGNISRNDGTSEQVIIVTSALVGPTAFLEKRNAESRIDSKSLVFERKVTGEREGEEFKFSASMSSYGISTGAEYLDFLPNSTQSFSTNLSIKQQSATASLDYELPLSDKSKFSVGAEVQSEQQSIFDSAVGSLMSGPINANNDFSGRSFDTSAYVTLQSQIGSIKVLPGLRVQRRRFDFDEVSGVQPVERTFAFPSLHLERKLGKLSATISISNRADWPSIGQFIPYRRVTGPTTVDGGNALLLPERSLGVELSGRFPLLGQQVSITLYDRRKKNVRETSILADQNGDILSTPINVGDRITRGGQVSFRGKLSSELGYSASAWFAGVEFDRLNGVTVFRERTEEYGVNTQLEYTAGKQGEQGFQQATLNLRYLGPTRFLQSETGGILAVDLAVTKFLTNRLSLVAAFNRLIGNRRITTVRIATLFSERFSSNVDGPLVRLSLVYNLGN